MAQIDELGRKIESELIGANFMVPENEKVPDAGYIDRDFFCENLKRGALIGQFGVDGIFHPDVALSQKYHKVIARLASVLNLDSRDPVYKSYKIAALDKGTLNMRFEWDVAQFLNIQETSYKVGQQILSSFGKVVLLVDMYGPAYDVVMPDRIELTKHVDVLDMDAVFSEPSQIDVNESD